MLTRAWIAFLIAAAPLGALRAQEVQVPLDDAGRVEMITPELARKLDLFNDVAGFREARLFRAADSSYVLEVTSGNRAGMRRDRRLLSATEAAAFRGDVMTRIAARAPRAVLDQSGRTRLLVGSTVLGLGYYGWAAAVALDPDDDKSALAAYMVTAASSFFLPFLATRTQAFSDASATLALWGAIRGPLHGYIFSGLGNANSEKTRFAWSLLFGVTEGIAGGVAGRSRTMTPGRAALTGAGGDLGLGVGFALSTVMGLDRRYKTVTEDVPFGGPFVYQVKNRDLQSAVMLAGSAAGLTAGYLAGRSGNWTSGDADVFRNVAGIGALAGIALGDIIAQPKQVTRSYGPGPNDTYSYYEDGFAKTHAAVGLVGLAGGAYLGQALVKGRSFTNGQGTLLTLAPLAGGLMGLGIAYLATSENHNYYYDPTVPYRNPDDHSRLYLSMSAIGAGAAFAALYPAFAKAAKGPELASRLSFSLNPLAAAQLISKRGNGAGVLGSIQYRF